MESEKIKGGDPDPICLLQKKCWGQQIIQIQIKVEYEIINSCSIRL